MNHDYLSFCSVLWSWWFLWAWATAAGRKPGCSQPGVRGESDSQAGWRLTHVRLPPCLHLHRRGINYVVTIITITFFRSDELWKNLEIIEDWGFRYILQIEAELSCLFNNYSVQAICFSPSHACQQEKGREELGFCVKKTPRQNEFQTWSHAAAMKKKTYGPAKRGRQEERREGGGMCWFWSASL